MSIAQRIRRAFAGPDIDADGWYTRGTEPRPAPELNPTWVDPVDDEAWARLDSVRRNQNLGVALPCGRWRRANEHDAHTWDDEGTVAQCPGWRGEP